MPPTDHPILPRPWEFEILEFTVRVDAEALSVDITFARPGAVRRLRFLRPQSIRFQEGPRGNGGGLSMADLRIYDLGADGLEGLRVHVINDGSSSGVLEFWAAEVQDLSA